MASDIPLATYREYLSKSSAALNPCTHDHSWSVKDLEPQLLFGVCIVQLGIVIIYGLLL